MEHTPPLLATLAVTLALAYLGASLARAARLSPLLGYLVAGVAVGPFTPGFTADPHLTAELAEIGVALLLFVVGLHFSLRDLVSVWRVAVPGALLQVAASTLLGYALARFVIGWPPQAALILGLAISIASTAVATREFEEHRRLHTPSGQIALGWLVMQDLVVVVALVLLPTLTAGGMPAGRGADLWAALGVKLLQFIVFIVAVLVVGRRIIPWALAWTARDGSRELFRLAVIVVALGVAYAAAAFAGLSLALGAFFAGVVIAESDMNHQAAAETAPIQQIFTVLFFVSVGMLLDPHVLWRAPLEVALLLVAIVVGNGTITLLLLGLGVTLAGAVAVAAALAQIGEFSFILTGLAATSGLLPSEGRDVVIAAALLAIAANPFVFRFATRAASRLEQSAPVRRWRSGRRIREGAPGQRPQDVSGHAILVGHGRVGAVVSASFREHGIPYIVVEQSLALARALRQEGVAAIYGDAGFPEVLGAARPETARVLVIAIPERGQVRRIVQAARESHPDLPVIVRTHSDAEADWLKAQRIEHVVMSERRTALEIAELALRSLGGEP